MKSNGTASTSHADTNSKPHKKIRGRVTVIRERCKGCEYCVQFCPTDVLEMSPDFNAKGYHFPRVANGRDCSGCDLCGMYCPDFAVSGHRVNAEGATGSPSQE